jgi:hypothetical protein
MQRVHLIEQAASLPACDQVRQWLNELKLAQLVLGASPSADRVLAAELGGLLTRKRLL